MTRLYTPGGYPFDEVTSAMQKCIRRRLTDDALYWAHELAGRYAGYVWRRLGVIVNEDVGLGCPTMLAYYARLAGSVAKQEPATLTDLVSRMADAPKTRLGDRALWVSWAREVGELVCRDDLPLVEVVDRLHQAIDDGDEVSALTWSAELLERSHAVHWTTLFQVADRQSDPGRSEVVRCLAATHAAYVRVKQRDHGGYLYAVNAVLLLTRRIVMTGEIPSATDHVDHVADGRPIPDLALDQHTGRGKALGRGLDHFLTVSAVVIPEAPGFDQYHEEFRRLLAEMRRQKWPLRRWPGEVPSPRQATLPGV